MNFFLRLRFAILAGALASSLLLHSAGCGTCEDGCSGGPPIEPEVSCSQSDSEDELRFLDVGDHERLEYGPQGGQHFFVSFATRPLAPEEQLLVVFETESDRIDALPSVDRSCGEISGVVVSQLAVVMPSDDEVDGTLTVAIVVCEGSEDGSCSWDESGDVVDYEVRAELSKDLRVAP